MSVGTASDTCGDAVPALLAHLHQFAALQGLQIVVFAQHKHIPPSKLLDLRDVLPLKGLQFLSGSLFGTKWWLIMFLFSGSVLVPNPWFLTKYAAPRLDLCEENFVVLGEKKEGQCMKPIENRENLLENDTDIVLWWENLR